MRERDTIKNSKKTNYLSINTIDSCLVKIFHGRSFPWRACISITEFPILTVAGKISNSEPDKYCELNNIGGRGRK
jgi:hypothetical protein